MTKSKFIVVEHDAKKARLHWDLRFQMPKSSNWASFAVRKGIPTKPGLKHLAIRTHDHSRAEALFIGTIKDGYGAGKLKKWDYGSCIIHKYSPSHIAIEFKGRKVKGMYHLISTGVVDKNYKRQTWFLFKGKIVTEMIDPKNWNPKPKPGDEGIGQYSDKIGLASQIRSMDVEIDDEQADNQQVKPLKWAVGTSKIKESFGSLSPGLVGKAPPSDTQEVESDNEAEDRKLRGILPWSLTKKIQMIRSKEDEYDHDD